MAEEEYSLRSFDRLEDRIRQHRQVSSAPIVIVEGPSDALTLRPHLDGFDVFPADGKTNVVSCCRALMSWALGGYACAVDRDYDWRDHTDIDERSVPYMLRDLEAMLIHLGVLENVLEHQGSADKIVNQGGASKVVSELMSIVEPVSRLRSQNQKEGWGIPFDKVDLASKIDMRDLKLKVANYCAALAGASEHRVTAERLLTAAEAPLDDEFGPRGKDVLVAAGVALRRKIGSLSQQAVAESVLVGQLHSSCGLPLSNSAWLQELKRMASS